VKKTLIGALASLMLAGAISALSGAPVHTTAGVIVIAGEGSAPIPLAGPPDNQPGNGISLGK